MQVHWARVGSGGSKSTPSLCKEIRASHSRTWALAHCWRNLKQECRAAVILAMNFLSVMAQSTSPWKSLGRWRHVLGPKSLSHWTDCRRAACQALGSLFWVINLQSTAGAFARARHMYFSRVACKTSSGASNPAKAYNAFVVILYGGTRLSLPRQRTATDCRSPSSHLWTSARFNQLHVCTWNICFEQTNARNTSLFALDETFRLEKNALCNLPSALRASATRFRASLVGAAWSCIWVPRCL